MSDLPPTTVKECRECPWRRKSAPGWLGPYDADEWVQIAHSDGPIACHMTIILDDPDAEDGDWEHPAMRQCLGAAKYRTNVLKLPRDPRVAVTEEKDTETVFANPREFLAHHEKENR